LCADGVSACSRDAGGDVSPSVLQLIRSGGDLPWPLLDQLEWGLGLGAHLDPLGDSGGDAAASNPIAQATALSEDPEAGRLHL
jgi:hypothetical protein